MHFKCLTTLAHFNKSFNISTLFLQRNKHKFTSSNPKNCFRFVSKKKLQDDPENLLPGGALTILCELTIFRHRPEMTSHLDLVNYDWVRTVLRWLVNQKSISLTHKHSKSSFCARRCRNCKKTDNQTIFLHFRNLLSQLLLVKHWWNWSQKSMLPNIHLPIFFVLS